MLDIIPVTQNPRPALPPPLASDQTEAPLAECRTTGPGSAPSPIRFRSPLSAAFRFVEPTWRNYITYVDMEARSGNADAARYVGAWNGLSGSERLEHLPEQLCDLVNVKPSDLFRWVCGQAWQEGAAKSSMCLSFMRDRVLEKTAEFAMESPENYKHADLFLRASGSLPTPNGRGGGSALPSVNFYNMPVASSGSVAGVKSDSAPVHASGLRGMDEEIVELSRVMQQDDGRLTAAERMPVEEEEADEELSDDEDEDDR